MGKVKYDTGIWYFYPEDRMLYFKGMLGERHNLKRDAMKAITDQIASDISDGTIEAMKDQGKVVLYFLCRLEPREHDTLYTMTTYVSSAYGESLIAILKDYDSYQRINLQVI